MNYAFVGIFNLQYSQMELASCLWSKMKLSHMIREGATDAVPDQSTPSENGTKQGKLAEFAHIFKGSYRLCTKVSDSAFCAIGWLFCERSMPVSAKKYWGRSQMPSCVKRHNSYAVRTRYKQVATETDCTPKRFGNQFNEKVHMPHGLK